MKNYLIKKIEKNSSNLLAVDSKYKSIFQNLPISFQKNPKSDSSIKYVVSKTTLTRKNRKNISISQDISNITTKIAYQCLNWTTGKKFSKLQYYHNEQKN